MVPVHGTYDSGSPLLLVHLQKKEGKKKKESHPKNQKHLLPDSFSAPSTPGHPCLPVHCHRGRGPDRTRARASAGASSARVGSRRPELVENGEPTLAISRIWWPHLQTPPPPPPRAQPELDMKKLQGLIKCSPAAGRLRLLPAVAGDLKSHLLKH